MDVATPSHDQMVAALLRFPDQNPSIEGLTHQRLPGIRRPACPCYAMATKVVKTLCRLSPVGSISGRIDSVTIPNEGRRRLGRCRHRPSYLPRRVPAPGPDEYA